MNSAGRRIGIASLRRRDFAYLAAALPWLLRAKALHLRRPAPALLRRLRAPAPSGPPRRALDPALMRWALAAWSRRLPWRSDCLVQSLAARLWADRARVPATFRLGARRTPSGLLAHAWVEIDGVVASGGQAVSALVPFAGPDSEGTRP